LRPNLLCLRMDETSKADRNLRPYRLGTHAERFLKALAFMILTGKRPVRDNLLKFRRRGAPTIPQSAKYPLWSMRKQALHIDCTIRDCAEHGWNVVFLFNTQWSSSHWFPTWH